jgi:2-oxoglutarate dehydrogenase complex dehydrogenase (E1) component-like enzyme
MMKSFQGNSYLFGGNAPYVEELYESYLNNPGSVSEQWRSYFDSMQVVPAADGNPQTRDIAHAPIVESFAERAKAGTLQPRVMGGDAATARKQVYVQQLSAADRFLEIEIAAREQRIAAETGLADQDCPVEQILDRRFDCLGRRARHGRFKKLFS